METFMTSREVEAEKLDRQKREKEQADAAGRDAQNARDNAARFKTGEIDWLKEQAGREEEKLCGEGNDRVTALAGLQRRASELRGQIESQGELAAIQCGKRRVEVQAGQSKSQYGPPGAWWIVRRDHWDHGGPLGPSFSN
jgi:hypothetical protein